MRASARISSSRQRRDGSIWACGRARARRMRPGRPAAGWCRRWHRRCLRAAWYSTSGTVSARKILSSRSSCGRQLIAVNITEWQLSAGRGRLREAAALPVAGDATRLPVASGSVDGVISVEAAFHFRSRRAFFDECFRVLRPGGVLSMSDISTERRPAGPLELVSGVTQLRVFGLRPGAAMTAKQIAAAARAAGFAAVEVTVCGDRVIAPVLQLIRQRLRTARGAPAAARRRPRAALAGAATVAATDHRVRAHPGHPALTRERGGWRFRTDARS